MWQNASYILCGRFQFNTNFLVIRAAQKHPERQWASLHWKYSSRYQKYLIMELCLVLNIFNKGRKTGTNIYEYLPLANILGILCKLVVSNSCIKYYFSCKETKAYKG